VWLRNSSIRQIRLSSACAVWVTHTVLYALYAHVIHNQFSQRRECTDRWSFSDDQECCIRGLRWQKEANDPNRPAHQRRNGSPTSQREGRHQDPEVYTTQVYTGIKSCDTFPLCHSCSAFPYTGRSRTAIYCNSCHTPWPLPAVRDLARDGRLSTYDVSVLKLSKVSFREKCARTGHRLKLPSPTKLAQLGHFPPASQGGPPCRPGVLCIYFFSGQDGGWTHLLVCWMGEGMRDLGTLGSSCGRTVSVPSRPATRLNRSCFALQHKSYSHWSPPMPISQSVIPPSLPLR